MQTLIVSDRREDFDSRVNTLLLGGAVIVPGTLEMVVTSHQKVGRTGGFDGQFLQSRYAVALELTDCQAQALVAAQAEQPAEPLVPPRDEESLLGEQPDDRGRYPSPCGLYPGHEAASE